jgi:hypothetical protein
MSISIGYEDEVSSLMNEKLIKFQIYIILIGRAKLTFDYNVSGQLY